MSYYSKLTLPGTTGSHASTPDHASLDITGDLDVRVKVALNDWTPPLWQVLVSKGGGAASGYELWMDTASSGKIALQWGTGVAAPAELSTVALGLTDGAVKWVRATLDVDNGAGAYEVKFYTSDDGVNWAQLGTTITGVSTTSVAANAGLLTIGARSDGSLPVAGKVYEAQVRNGIDGVLVSNPIFTTLAPGATSFTDSQGRAWSVNGSAAVEKDLTAFYVADYEMSIGSNEFVLGGPGSPYLITGWSGLGVPTMRTSDSERPQDHGSFLGPDLIGSRYVRLDVTVRGDNPDEVVANIDALLAEWYLDSRTDTDAIKPLTLTLPGQVARRLNGRPRRADLDPRRIIGNRADGVLEYFAADPRWYSDAEHSQGLVLAAATTGRSYNKSFDYGYGGAGSSGVVSVSNAGSIGTLPTVQFNGPVTNPYIENITTGKTLRLNYTLLAGEYIIVNFAEATVLLAGTASRYYAKSGDFWELIPGDNDVRFGASAYDAAASATLTWRDAWL